MPARRQGDLRCSRVAMVCLVVAAAGLSGCGPREPHGGELRVKATLAFIRGGEPVRDAWVDLHGSNASWGGSLNTSGIAEMAVSPGVYKVTLVPPRVDPALWSKDGTPPSPPKRPDIPAAVRDMMTTPLQIEVVKGKDNTFSFDIGQAEGLEPRAGKE